MKSPPVSESDEAGLLGVAGLKSFWARQLKKRESGRIGQIPGEQKFDRIMIDGLGLALEETVVYLLREAPTFSEFERWVLGKNDGHIDESRIERINRTTEGRPYSEKLQQQLQEIEKADPVLSEEDLKFWDDNGYVIVRDAVTREEAGASEKAVWQFLKMDPDSPDTWYKPAGKGIMTDLYHHPALNNNRRSKRIHKAFAQLWKTPDLWITTDRAGFNPPEKPGWHFPGPRLHWDMDLTPPFHFGLQGILYLCDVAAEQGAFYCVPGFHKKLETWLEDLPAWVDPREQNLEKMAVPVAARAGDLIIWHQFLPHGSSPNRGNYPRIVQYLTMRLFAQDEAGSWR